MQHPICRALRARYDVHQAIPSTAADIDSRAFVVSPFKACQSAALSWKCAMIRIQLRKLRDVYLPVKIASLNLQASSFISLEIEFPRGKNAETSMVFPQLQVIFPVERLALSRIRLHAW